MNRRAHLVCLCVLAVVLAAACSKDNGPPPPKNEIAAMMAKPNAVVLDVRTTSEYAQGHVPGALHVPVSDIRTRAASALGADKARPIVVHCAVGMRSARAAKELAELGYTNILDAKSPTAITQALGVALE